MGRAENAITRELVGVLKRNGFAEMTVRKRKSATSAAMQGIIRLLRDDPTVRGVFWRANVGGAKFGESFVRYGFPGQPDLMGVFRDGPVIKGVQTDQPGAFFGIEAKTAKGRTSEFQELFGDILNALNATYVVARCENDLIDAGFGKPMD